MSRIRSDFPATLSEIVAVVTERDILKFLPTIEGLCQSPIEAMLGAAIFYVHRSIHRARLIYILGSSKVPPNDRANTYLVPQAPFESYRIDWIYYYNGAKILIECDGHDFHERTKEQAAHDRSKDRAIQLAGLPILRFTGSEIHRDIAACAVQVIQLGMDRATKPVAA